MFQKHPAFQTPQRSNILWRYLSFPKFVSLLSHRALFFPSIETLRQSDKYEGYLPVPNEDNEHRSIDIRAGMNEPFNEHTAVSCWYMGDEESAAMWKLYDDAIAIRTTVGSLIDSLQGFKATDDQGNLSDVDFHVGEIEYLKTSAYDPPSDNPFYPVLHKRNSYRHESEVRVIYNIWPGPGLDIDTKLPFYLGGNGKSFPELKQQIDNSGGIFAPVDVNKLIDEILVSPWLDSWILETVRTVIRDYGVGKEATQSLLNTLN